MEGILGISLQRLIETILAILALVFFLIEKVSVLNLIVLLTVFVVVYLLIVVLLTLARRDGAMSSGNQVTLECVFGVLLLLYSIVALNGSSSNLVLAAYIMDLIVGVLFLIFALF